jgi:hypothetical protein
MILYRLTRREIRSKIDTEKPGWLADTQNRTSAFIARKKFDEEKSVWSTVKAVYMRLQGGQKCAFCERKLESEEFGAGEQAVEHFRPKGRVMPWRAPAAVRQQRIPITTVKRGQNGYYWLAYDPFNYSAACHPCNSSLKGDRFPISGNYRAEGTPEELRTEKPLLIYPLGNFDDDPEELIEFNGASPVPKRTTGRKFHRAFVTIEFFRLDDAVGRGNLFKERARIICAIQCALDSLAGQPDQSVRARAEGVLTRAIRPESPHTNCARSFLRLAKANPAVAARLADAAAALDDCSS